MKKICFAAIIIYALNTGLFFIPCANSKDLPSREDYVKAAFLYNFAKFIKWPNQTFATPESPLVLCILGKNPFGGALSSISKKKIRGRNLVIKQCINLNHIKSCNILFISKSKHTEINNITKRLKKMPVLTVSDVDEFIEHNGIIGMTKVKNKIRFQINFRVAQDCGLTISSQLLKLATKIIK